MRVKQRKARNKQSVSPSTWMSTGNYNRPHAQLPLQLNGASNRTAHANGSGLIGLGVIERTLSAD
jgi:hypothetical protein